MKTRLPARAPAGVLLVCFLLVLLSDRVHAATRSASATNSLISRRHGSSSFSLSDVPHKNTLLKEPRAMPFQDGLGPDGRASEEEQETKSHGTPPETRARWRSSSSMGALKNLTDKITSRSFMAGSLFASAILLLMGLGSNANLIKESFSGDDEGFIQQKNSDASVMAGLSSSSRNKLLLGGVGLLFLLASSLAVPAPTPEPPSPPVTRVPAGENGHGEVIQIGKGWKEADTSKQGQTLISLTFNGQMYELYLPKSTEEELKDKPGQLEALKEALSSNAQLSWAATAQPEETTSSYYWQWGWKPSANLLYDSDERWPGVRFVFHIPEDVSDTLHATGAMTEGCRDVIALLQTLAEQVHTPTAIPRDVQVETWEEDKPHPKSTKVPLQDYLAESSSHKTCVVGRGWQDGTKTLHTRPAVPFYGFQDGQNAIQFELHRDKGDTVGFKILLTRSMEEALGGKKVLQKFVAALSSPPEDIEDEQGRTLPEKQSAEEGLVWKFPDGEKAYAVEIPDERAMGPVRRWGSTRDADAALWLFQAGGTTYHVYMPRDAYYALKAKQEARDDAAYLINAAVLKIEAERTKK